ncbi:hypothetical protein CICLE_v10027522mg, partial [Citrus x clementina]
SNIPTHQIQSYYVSLLQSCIAQKAVSPGKQIHALISQMGFGFHPVLATKLVHLYSACDCLHNAHQLFDRIPQRNLFLWNVLIRGYAWNGPYEVAIELYYRLLEFGLVPDNFTFPFALKACSALSAIEEGRRIHEDVIRNKWETDVFVGAALIDMYAKCSCVVNARQVFDKILERDVVLREKRVVSWNAMITGYAMHGHSTKALDLFEKMKDEVQPDHITFVGVLSACSRGGLFDEGRMFFESMVRDYHIDPSVQHYTCMVDLLGHSGRLDEACDLIMQMRVKPDPGVWGALLNSCKLHGHVKLAELALEKLIELEPHDAGNYVILSNIYARAANWEGVAKLRKLMIDRGIKKSIACSWIEVKNKAHAFLSGDASHPNCDEIYAKLKWLEGRMKEAGYVPGTESVFHDVENDEKANMICCHSERLAIAFGLINTPDGTRLLITKNLKICDDCHIAIKFISKITEREITVRDVNRYHHFKDGICSCGDYW